MPERALKFAVVGMGVLIVIGLVVIFVTIAKRMGAGKGPDDAAAAVAPIAAPVTPFGDTVITIPRGGRMVDFRSDGNRIEEIIHVIDLATGKPLGTVTVAPPRTP